MSAPSYTPLQDRLLLGTVRGNPKAPVTLPTRALSRHVMALGSSGSGKTVLCKGIVEEAVRQGIPALCIDPQGDVASLALKDGTADPAPPGGVEPTLMDGYRTRADVVVFTPASRAGVPLCADPVRDPTGLSSGERLRAFSRQSNAIASLLGYDLDHHDGAGFAAVVDRALHDLADGGTPATNLDELRHYLDGREADGYAPYTQYLDARKIRHACQRLARLSVGARRLMFHDGVPLDIDVLLGRDDVSGVPGSTRVSVIYLNTLHSREDKQFFVASLVDRLHSWMLEHPSDEPQLLFYIDEVSPYVPPVREPAAKQPLQRLFKQARKYGVCCAMATQNPADVDYKAMSQFGTWGLGRLATRQDRAKVAPVIKSLAPAEYESVMNELPALAPGEFFLVSPDHLDRPCPLRTRWLISRHETLDETRIQTLADERWRRRFAALVRDHVAGPTLAPTARGHGSPSADSRQRPTPHPKPPPAPDPRSRGEGPRADGRSRRQLPPPRPAAQSPRAESALRSDADSAVSAELEPWARKLGKRQSMTANEFADRCNVGVTTARARLRDLVAAGLASHYKAGRVQRYWAHHTGARPDLGIRGKITVAEPTITAARIAALGQQLARTPLLGVIGDAEEYHSAELTHRMLYKLVFEETVERSLFHRLVGDRYERRLGSVFLHPHTLEVAVYRSDKGIVFDHKPTEYASELEDLESVMRFADARPGDVALADADWLERRTLAEVKRHFRTTFAASPRTVTPVFVPVWDVQLRKHRSTRRRLVAVDALVGRPVDWP